MLLVLQISNKLFSFLQIEKKNLQNLIKYNFDM